MVESTLRRRQGQSEAEDQTATPNVESAPSIKKQSDLPLPPYRRQVRWAVVYSVVLAVMLLTKVVKIPILVQMLGYTLPILWLGSHASLRLLKHDGSGQVTDQGGEVLTKRDAMMMPVMASVGILAIHLALKYLPKAWITGILGLLVGLWAIHAMAQTAILLMDGYNPPAPPPECVRTLRLIWPLSWIAGQPNVQVDISRKSLAIWTSCFTASVAWWFSQNWLLHNAIAIAFSIQAIATISVGTFNRSAVMLILLFFYDIFWVFGTNVMVNVATSLDIPIKILFATGWNGKNSLLGLGDIVLPGLFVAMALRFDYSLSHKCGTVQRRFRKPYFFTALVAYGISLLTTGAVMLGSGRAQPALLYLVPGLLIAHYGSALVRGQLHTMAGYSEDEPGEAEDSNSASGSEHEDEDSN